MKETAYLKCDVRVGLFSGERAIKIDLQGAESISALVDESDVLVSGEPSVQFQPGKIRVHIVEKRESTSVVILPRETLSGGATIIVPNETVLP